MSVIPAGIWFMWFLVFGMSIAAIVIAVVLNKREGGKIKW